MTGYATHVPLKLPLPAAQAPVVVIEVPICTLVPVSRMIKVSTPTGIGIVADEADPVYSVVPALFVIVTPGLLIAVQDKVKLQEDAPDGIGQGV